MRHHAIQPLNQTVMGFNWKIHEEEAGPFSRQAVKLYKAMFNSVHSVHHDDCLAKLLQAPVGQLCSFVAARRVMEKLKIDPGTRLA